MATIRAERRLTVIMAADIVGYSRLMEMDEAATLATIRALRAEVINPLVAVHDGRVVKLMGDGALFEFHSVVDAVACAAAMQEGIAAHQARASLERRIVFRIGINLGDVVIDQGDLLGEGVNVAARLEQLCAPGGVLIAGTAYDHLQGKLDLSFDFIGEQALKNMARPVRTYCLRADGAETPMKSPHPPPSLPDKPSIAVLPFQNMSGDPEQDYFADGMVEDITTALSRIRWLFVIARNSSFTYKGRAVDVKQVGRELGVRYVLEGSVRKAGNRVRITGQLIEASSAAHLWADRFDGELADVFDLQDRVTASVVGAIAPRLEQAEIERAQRKPTESLDAYDYFLRGMAAFYQFSLTNNKEALALFLRATELDPNFASAYGMAARCYLQRKGFGWVADRELETSEAERLARRAAALGRDDAVALANSGMTLVTVTGDLDEGPALIERSLSLNPNLAWVWHFSAFSKAYLGEPGAAIEHAHRAMRFSPQDPQMFALRTAAALADFVAGRTEEALAGAEAALREQPNFFVGTCVAAAAGGLAGKLGPAQKAMARLRQLNPDLRISNLRDLLPFKRPEDFARWSEGLRKAGLPD